MSDYTARSGPQLYANICIVVYLGITIGVIVTKYYEIYRKVILAATEYLSNYEIDEDRTPKILIN